MTLATTLLLLARGAVSRELGITTELPPRSSELEELRATFVTITTADDDLRGCIGSLEPRRPLWDDVAENARAAAFHDPRFPPLTKDELPLVRFEVSLLSPFRDLPVASEADAIARLRPHVDGVVFEVGKIARATFLPQVWEQVTDAREFLAHLRRKAGLAGNYWSDDVRLRIYEVEKFEE